MFVALLQQFWENNIYFISPIITYVKFTNNRKYRWIIHLILSSDP